MVYPVPGCDLYQSSQSCSGVFGFGTSAAGAAAAAPVIGGFTSVAGDVTVGSTTGEKSKRDGLASWNPPDVVGACTKPASVGTGADTAVAAGTGESLAERGPVVTGRTLSPPESSPVDS